MRQSDEAWRDVGDQFKQLGSMFKRNYDMHENPTGPRTPSDDEVKEALRTLGEGVRQAFSTVGDAFNDPEIKDESKQAIGLFFDALSATFSDLGADFSRSDDES